MRDHVNLANTVTSVSLAVGFAALLLASGSVGVATVLVVIAAVLDGLDGVLARRRGGDRTFGAQLDSLADLLAFCIVPAFALQQAAEQDALVVGAVVAGLFVLAGAWRLARFALQHEPRHFVGLPTPAAGILLMLLVLWAPVPAALLGAVALSALMVSPMRVPTVPTVCSAAGAARRARRDDPADRE